MLFSLFSAAAATQLWQLEKDRGLAKRLKAVRKTIGHLAVDPRHPMGPRFRGVQSFVSRVLSTRSDEWRDPRDFARASREERRERKRRGPSPASAEISPSFHS
jgi:hypothetical protein